MIDVVIADDHAIVRHGIRELIDAQTDMRVVGEAATAQELIDQLLALPRDVLVVLDLSLPDERGLALLGRVLAAAPRTKVVIFSMYPEDQLALHLLREGASAYLDKQRDPDELLTAIRRVGGGGRYVTETLSDLALLAPAGEELPHRQLSAREYQVFMLVLEGKKVGEIAAELELSASTASNHLAAIRGKLGASSIADIVRYASRVGLV